MCVDIVALPAAYLSGRRDRHKWSHPVKQLHRRPLILLILLPLLLRQLRRRRRRRQQQQQQQQ